MTVVVREVDRGWTALKATVKLLKDRSYVKVGVLDDGKGAAKEGDLTSGELAAVQEFGTKDGKIPARSFVGSTFDKGFAAYYALLRTLVGGIYDGKMTIEKALNIMGLKMATDIKKTVTIGEGVPPPNAPSTIAHKEKYSVRKGTIRTLVDTGRMLDAVSWLVFLRPKGDEK